MILGPPIIGGAEIRYANLYSYLKSNGADVRLFINKSRFGLLKESGILDGNDANIEITEYFGDSTVPADNIKTPQNETKIKKNPFFLRRLISSVSLHMKFLAVFFKILKWQRKNKINLIMAVFQGVFAITPYYYQKKVKTVISYNDSEHNLINNRGLNWCLGYRLGLKKADAVDILSNDLLNDLKLAGYGAEMRAHVSPCSFIDYERFRPAAEKENIVIFCGRLIMYKNPLLFVEAVGMLKEELPDYYYYMIGKGPMYTEISESIKKLGLENSITVKYDPHPEKYLSRSKIFVSLQETNNYPSQSLLEAIACGNAVIATDVGETRRILDGEKGILIKKDAVELKNAVLKLAKNENERKDKARNAYDFILSNHNIQKYSAYITCLFEKTLNTP